MSYSLSIKVKKDFSIPELVASLEKELIEEIDKLKKHGFFIHYQSVLVKDIPYGPSGERIVGFNINAINFDEDASLYYRYKIIQLAKKYSAPVKAPHYEEKLPYYYFDDEVTYILSNDKIKDTYDKFNLYGKKMFRFSPEDQFANFSLADKRSLIRKLFDMRKNKMCMKMKKILVT